MEDILCIIPARSGSKGIPDKNIKLMHGKPLIYWSIDQAKKSKYIDKMRIIVSTDSEKYRNIALKYGAEVPFLRPNKISNDKSTDFEYINHAIEWLKKNENYNPHLILQLRPTQPCRDVNDIDKCIEIMIKNYNKYDSLRTVIEAKKSPYKMYYISDNTLKPYFNKYNNLNEPFNIGRQQLPTSYLHNGYIDIIKPVLLKRNIISGSKIYPYVMNDNDNIDIDDVNDWEYCEKKMESYINKNNRTISIEVGVKDNKLFIKNSEDVFNYFKREKITNVPIKILDDNNNKNNVIYSDNNICYLKKDNLNFEPNKKYKMHFFDNNIFQILNNYDIHKLLSKEFISYISNKNVILCGNGSNGYQENESNKFIDSHDVIVRINGFEIVPKITGTKTDIHFIGSTICTNGVNPYKKNHSNSEYKLIINSCPFKRRLEKIYKTEKKTFLYDSIEIRNLHNKIFGTRNLMSGTQALLIFTLLKIHCNINLDYIGFSDHKLSSDGTQSYYWGKRKLQNKRDLIRHKKYHDFHLQFLLIDIINFY